MVALRRTVGYTQIELADTLGVTQRMISWYEDQSDPPPSTLPPKLAKALGVSVDELLDIKAIKANREQDSRLGRRLQQVAKPATGSQMPGYPANRRLY